MQTSRGASVSGLGQTRKAPNDYFHFADHNSYSDRPFLAPLLGPTEITGSLLRLLGLRASTFGWSPKPDSSVNLLFLDSLESGY